jgi:hypothetical protein
MTATCVVQLPGGHPLLPQLQMAATNAANDLLHTALMQQQDAALLQLLVESHELNQLFVQLASSSLGYDNSSSSSGGGGGGETGLQPAVLPAPTAAVYELTQLAGTVSKQLGLNSSSSTSAGDAAAVGSALGIVTVECQLAAALLWHQHQQVLCLSGSMPIGQTSAFGRAGSSSSSRVLPVELAFLQSSSSSQHMEAAAAAAVAGDAVAHRRAGSENAAADAAVYGLSSVQLLVLSQGCGGGLLQLLLLDSVRLLLLQHTAQRNRSLSEVEFREYGRRQQQQQWCWKEVLSVLQNAVATASTSSNSLLTEAAVGCLSSLYTAAAAEVHAAAAAADDTTDDDDENNTAAEGTSTCSAGHVVASSAWNTHVLKPLLQRLCQQAVTLRAAAQQAQQMAAAGGQSCGQTGQTAGMCSWLCDVDCQQQCQAWCCNAQLLLSYIQLVHAASCVTHDKTAAGGDVGAGSSSRQQSELLTGLQQLLAPLVEQQQLVPFLCWAAARSSWAADCAAAAGYSNSPQHAQQLWHQQQDHWQQQVNGGYGQQQQRSSGLSAAAAAACCLQLSISRVSLQLLAALMQSGCFARQLPWLQQQLQQQLWAVSQQQQQQQQQQGIASFQGSAAAGGAAAGAAGGGVDEGVLQQLLAAGGLQALSAVEVVDGLAVGLLRPAVVQLLLLPAAGGVVGSSFGGSGGDVGSGVLGVADCQALLTAVADAIKQQQQQQQ